MTSDKPFYKKREPVQLDFNVVSATGKPVQGSFSVSVTDSKNVIPDTTNFNIISYLLLTSDLKGYIENPQDYFTDNSYATREKTDILMLTQGWRRFNTSDYVKGKNKPSEFYLEAGQTVSGEVLNVFGKPAINRDVILLSTYKNKIRVTKTDSLGRFLIDGIEFPDSTTIILKAKSKTKLVDVEMVWDKDVFPPAHIFIPDRKDQLQQAPKDYFLLSKEKYYTEGGMLNINLDEFTVEGEAKKKDPQDILYSQLADNVINSEKLEDDYAGLQLLDIISMVPGVQVNGQQISIRGASGNPLFVIDGIETDNMDDISYLNTSDIEAIYVFKGVSASTFGSRGGNGVIAITLKKGVQFERSEPSSLAKVKPLGYQKPAEFYVPKYDVDSVLESTKSDLRTTIYWNPEIETDDAGNMRISFYTADKTNDYNIEIEGIGKSGEICRYKGILKRLD